MFDFSEKFRKIKILVKIVQNCDLSKSLESWKIPISQKAWFFSKLPKKIYSNQKNLILFTILKQISISVKTSKDLDFSHNFKKVKVKIEEKFRLES